MSKYLQRFNKSIAMPPFMKMTGTKIFYLVLPVLLFVFSGCSTSTPKKAIAQKKSEEITDSVLYDNDIFITPGTIFGSQGEGYIRFSLCVESEVIKEAISRL